MAEKNVVVLVGSLRKAAFSRRMAKALIGLAPAALLLEIVEIGELPLYNQDLETDNPPATWSAFRDRVRAAQALLFVTPEYNRSVPAALKNAIDVGSRPVGKSIWNGKPAAIVSTSPGAIGGFGANHHLRQSLAALGVPAMAKEAYLGGVDKLFEAEEKLVPATSEFLGKFMHAYAEWIDRNTA
jgi:chromate reductase